MFSGYPGFVPGTLLAIAISLAVNGLVSRALFIRRSLALIIIMALGLIFSATLTVGEGLSNANNDTRHCDFTRLALAPVVELLELNETSLNVLLFVPLGLVIGLIQRSPRIASILVIAVSLPFCIETVQLLLPVMNRTCQSADVIDNLFGLAVGFILGTLVLFLQETIL